MSWADEVEQAVEQSLDNSFDPSLEDVGMDLNAQVETEGEGGGGTRPSRVGNRQNFVSRTTDYDNPISQRFSNDYVDIIGSEAGLQAVVDAVKTGVQEALGTSVTDEDLMNQAIAKQNQFGHPVFTSWNKPSESIPAVDTFAGIQQAANATRIRDAEARMRAKIGNFIQSLTPEEGWASKIMEAVPFTTTFTPASQSFNPFKSDWAQKNLYGTTQPTSAIGYLPTAYKDAVAAKAWVDKNYPSDVGFDSTIDQSAGPSVTSQQVSPGVGDWSQDFQIPTQNLGNVLDKLGGQGLLTGAALAEETLGAPGSWYGQTPVQVAMGTGYGPYGITMATEEFDSPTPLAGTPYDANEFVMGAGPYGTMATEESDTGFTPVQEDLGMGITVNTDVNQAIQDIIDIGSGVDSFSGIPVTTQTTGDPLDDKQSYMDLVNALNAQPIGSSPISQQYSNVFQEKYSDFPQNPGLGTGTNFPDEDAFINEDGQLVIKITGGPQATGTGIQLDSEEFEMDWSPNMTQTQLEESWEANTDLQKAIEKQQAKKATKKEEQVINKYGTWDGKFNKKTAKQNLEAQLTFRKAFIEDFEKKYGSAKHWGLTKPTKPDGTKLTNKENAMRNRIMSTDQFLRAYDAVYGTSKGAKMIGGALSKGLSLVGGGLQGFFNKKGAGNADILDDVIAKIEAGEYENQGDGPPPSHPKDKVSGGFWGLINFAKQNPKIFGSLSGDELWALVSDPDGFWSFYEAGLAGD